MQINNRKDICDFIVSIEQKFPVDTWTFNEIHFWPIIRISLYFYLINATEIERDTIADLRKNNQTSSSPKSINPDLLYKIRWRIRRVKGDILAWYSLWKYKLWRKGLKQKDNLFVGSKSHRVSFKGTLYNRFFDTIIETGKIRDSSAVLEYGYDERLFNIANKDLSIQYDKGLNLLKSAWSIVSRHPKEVVIEADEYNNFIEYLAQFDLFGNYLKVNRDLKGSLNDTILYSYLSTDILGKLKPEKIYSLCYYSFEPLMLISVANRMGIETIEMQHGPQTELHLAYGSWTKIPKEGFNTLPRRYWNWDEESAKNIMKYLGRNHLYKSFVGGHPWINYWKNKKSEIDVDDKFILYSLQPSPIKIQDLFHPNIINTIRQSNRLWYIRLHPRQEINESQLNELMTAYGIRDKVNIKEANQLHLPQLLKKCLMNVTFSSGVTIEADLFGKKTIVLSKLGMEYFPELIQKGKALYLDYEDEDFVERFLNIEDSILSEGKVEKL